jgi:hypothetical protein
MKVLNVCETPLLTTEVYDLIKNNPRNELAFLQRDLLENPDIADPDDLRRLVCARRTRAFLENCLSIEEIKPEFLPRAIVLLRSYGLSVDIITRLVDASVLTGSVEGGLIYQTAILRDEMLQGRISSEQLEKIQNVLSILTGKQEGNLEEIEIGTSVPPSKKRVSSKR